VVSVTADSNIWVSASTSREKPRRLIEMADAGEIDLAVSEAIITEVLHVLRDNFQWSDEGLAEAQYQMNTTARKVVPAETVDVIREDPADNRILECAAAARSDYINIW
jgi:putative PIN family toxin of toxin-antitoxin system